MNDEKVSDIKKIWFLLAAAVLLFFVSLYASFSERFYKPPDADFVFFSVFDFFISLTIVCVLHFRFRFLLHKTINDQLVRRHVRFYLTIGAGLLLLVCVSFADRVDLLLRGVSRQLLLDEIGVSRLMMLITPISCLLFSIYFSFKKGVSGSIFFLFLLILVSVYTLSRSIFLLSLFMIFVMVSLYGGSLQRKSALVIFVFGVVAVLLASVMTILQGRSTSISSGLVNSWEAFLKYRAFSFHLAEVVEDKSGGNIEHILFSFFGFFYERFMSLFFEMNNPISVQGSTFVSEFVSLGPTTAYSANVVYPWWAWFYVSYGFFGLIFKGLYCLGMGIFLLVARMPITYFYFIYVMLFGSWIRHPFLNNDSVYIIIAAVFLDLLFRFARWRRIK